MRLGQPRGWVVSRKRWLISSMCLVSAAIATLVLAGYLYNWTWTGFLKKSLWDWMQLLIVPVVLTIGAILFNLATSRNELAIALDNQREALLQDYLDRMSELLLRKKSRKPAFSDKVKNIARARTLTVLRRLDSNRKGSLIQFLCESELISTMEHQNKIDLNGADLSHANLSGANLRATNLSGTDLSQADLSEADLSRADLKRANLTYANFYQANLYEAVLEWTNSSCSKMVEATLHWANLSYIDLNKADLNHADLYEANLSHAILNKTNLKQAGLMLASLDNATLRRVNLRKTDIDEVNFNSTTLQRVNLKRAIFQQVNQNTSKSGITSLLSLIRVKLARVKKAPDQTQLSKALVKNEQITKDKPTNAV